MSAIASKLQYMILFFLQPGEEKERIAAYFRGFCNGGLRFDLLEDQNGSAGVPSIGSSYQEAPPKVTNGLLLR